MIKVLSEPFVGKLFPALTFLSIACGVCGAQALQRNDVTLGVGVASGIQSNALSQTRGVIGEITFSVTDRLYVQGAGGRFAGSFDDEAESIETTHEHFLTEAGVGVQFRLQRSISPFLDGGLAGIWGSGTEVDTLFLGDNDTELEFWRIAVRLGGGVRYVRKPSSRWGVSAYYRLYLPVHGYESQAEPLFALRSDQAFERIGATLFVRF